jgi:hypothetical protein
MAGSALALAAPGFARAANLAASANSTFQVSAPNVTLPFGTDTTITATIADANGNPVQSGSAALKLSGPWAGFGAAPQWDVAIDNGTATFSVPTGGLPVGSWWYEVGYPLGSRGNVQRSSTIALAYVTITPLAVVITVPDVSVPVGATAAGLTATMPTLPPPLHTYSAEFGTISFAVTSNGKDAAKVDGVAIVNGIAQASCALPAGLGVGSYPIVARLNGWSRFFAPSSGNGTLTVTAD